MLQLNSKNFSTVQVFLKEEILLMPAHKGTALMYFLTSDNNSSHVMITTTQGKEIVINKYDIKMVSPVTSPNKYKTPDEMGMDHISPGDAPVRVYR